MIHLPALVVLLTAALVFVTVALTGRARARHGIKAPATSGHPTFERAYRVQMNTLEHTVMFLPTLWLAASYANPTWAGIVGLIWIVARAWYIPAYMTRPASRGKPFLLASIAWLVLFVMAVFGVIRLVFFTP